MDRQILQRISGNVLLNQITSNKLAILRRSNSWQKRNARSWNIWVYGDSSANLSRPCFDHHRRQLRRHLAVRRVGSAGQTNGIFSNPGILRSVAVGGNKTAAIPSRSDRNPVRMPGPVSGFGARGRTEQAPCKSGRRNPAPAQRYVRRPQDPALVFISNAQRRTL